MSIKVFAGSLEPPGPPGSSNSAMYTIEAVYQRLDNGTPGVKWTGGFREPTAPPGPTMHDMNEVMAKAPSRDDTNGGTTNDMLSGKTFWGLTSNEWGTQTGSIPTCTLSSNTVEVQAGYYEAITLTNVDTDLASTNIRVDVTLFGVTGANYACFVPKTGQTNTYEMENYGADGALQKGIAWPVPRFTINEKPSDEDTVTDNLTGLMWTKNANMWWNVDWTNAVTNCNSLVYGGYDDWRLPNVRELCSLVHFGFYDSALPDTTGTNQWTSGNPFTSVRVGYYYWTSTTCTDRSQFAWGVNLIDGYLGISSKDNIWNYAWPVRGGP